MKNYEKLTYKRAMGFEEKMYSSRHLLGLRSRKFKAVNFQQKILRRRKVMDYKGKSLTSLTVMMLLIQHAVVNIMASNMSYQNLKAYAENTLHVVKKAKTSLTTQHSINESAITQSMNKWNFGISDCWNYTLLEEERLKDNYIRLRIFGHHANGTVLKISRNVVIEIGNLHRAIKRMRRKLSYPSIKITKIQDLNITTTTQYEQGMLQVVFLSTVKKNLHLMLNDIRQRIQPKA